MSAKKSLYTKKPEAKTPEQCRHGPLEYIEAFVHAIPESDSLVPKFVCLKCSAVFFLSRNMVTGAVLSLKTS